MEGLAGVAGAALFGVLYVLIKTYVVPLSEKLVAKIPPIVSDEEKSKIILELKRFKLAKKGRWTELLRLLDNVKNNKNHLKEVLNVRDDEGKTIMDYAVEQQENSVIQKLKILQNI